MKASIRLSAIRTEEEAEEDVKKEYHGIKENFFYIIFTVVSILLLWNALTPSRKV
jgi:hypothetical protein